MFRQPITYPNRKQQGAHRRHRHATTSEGRPRNLSHCLLLADALSLVYTTPTLEHGFTITVSLSLPDQTLAAIASVYYLIAIWRTYATNATGRCSRTYFFGTT